MERTSEFRSIVNIFVSHGATQQQTAAKAPSQTVQTPPGPSAFLQAASKILQQLRYNDELVEDMNRIASKKEFSHEPMKNMQETTSTFQTRAAWIQDQIKKMKSELESSYEQNAKQKHKEHIISYLSKSVATQLNAFKHALKAHGKHIEERNKRVQQYGHTQESSMPMQSSASNGKYAMFGASESFAPPVGGVVGGVGLHHRSAYSSNSSNQAPHSNPSRSYNSINSSDNGSSSNSDSYSSSKGHVVQQVLQKPSNAFRFQAAEKVESSIRQMGELFTRMASLVAEQGEVITRIEDDVEEGLANTIEAKDHIQRVYDITKGNRGLIIKIFAILLFFILLFLIWT